jgi:zinc/manganese transport system permease protein
LRDLLTGQILWVRWEQIAVVATLSAAVLAMRAWLAQRGSEGGFAFYALFAMAVTASVQLVGVLLVFASLIAPAVATRGVPEPQRLPRAFAVGALGYGIGLAASLAADLPAGAAAVCTLVLLAAVGLFLWRRPASADFS